MKFCFGDIVVVEGNLIGVILSSWVRKNKEIYYEVYVRVDKEIREYDEKDIQRYMVRHKILDETELEYQDAAINPYITEKDVIEFLSKLNFDKENK